MARPQQDSYENYPEHGDPDFSSKLMRLQEYQMFEKPDTGIMRNKDEFEAHTREVCTNFDKLHQHFIEHYLSHRSPYRSLLLYHSLGVGKSCSAITVAEAMLSGHVKSEEPRIIVISSKSLSQSFDRELRGSCTDSFYKKLGQDDPKRISDIIKSRYTFLTYDGVITYAKQHKGIIHGKTIIVDEAHNFRSENEAEKESAEAFMKMIKKSAQVAKKEGLPLNRMVLLSATPMYDKPQEIIWLLKLLLYNDGRDPKELLPPLTMFDKDDQLSSKAKLALQQLSAEYISYIKSQSPFAFATRLSPKQSGIPVLEDEWSGVLGDGIVTTLPGDKQVLALDGYQQANITYPVTKGDETSRFYKVFIKKNTTHFSLQYASQYQDLLLPTPDNLGRIAAKMQRICDLIRDSEGIVMIYSRYIYDGVLPLAIALEHMGMNRFGDENILTKPTLVSDAFSKIGGKMPNYAILSGDKDVMGATTIDGCLKEINSPRNIDGKNIKVVLLTQIAAEGLSLYNIREVHVLEPWFHMNRLDQVIGRAIRTCSHKSLPLQKRNVTVFLHALQGSSSPDIHVYKTFVVKKLSQIQQIENVIRENAVDCQIMRSMNYFPKSNFPFSVVMRTSRKIEVPVQIGSDSGNYVCRSNATNSISKDVFGARHLLHDSYEHLIPLVIKRAVRLLTGARFVTLSALEAGLKLDPKLFRAALPYLLYPNVVVPGHKIYMHLDGLYMQPDSSTAGTDDERQKQRQVTKIKIPSVAEQRTDAKEEEIIEFIEKIPRNDPAISTYMLYMMIDSGKWDAVAQMIVKTQTYHDLAYSIRKCGAFVFADELSRGAKTKPVGYVDIFDAKDNSFTATLYVDGAFREADPNEKEIIKAARIQTWTSKDLPSYKTSIAMFVPEKRGTSVTVNNFKILTPSTDKAVKKSGKVCTSFTEKQLIDMLTEIHIGQSSKKQSKHELCISLGFGYMRADRVIVLPQYKPKTQN